MVFCCVDKCHNRPGKKNSVNTFYRIPKIIKHHGAESESLSTERRKEWLRIIKLDKSNLNDNYRVCNDHFTTGKPAKLFETLHPDWLPTMNLGYPKRSFSNSNSRYNRAQNRSINKNQNQQTSVIEFQAESPTSPAITNDDSNAIDFMVMVDLLSGLSMSTQTELTMHDINLMEKPKNKLIVNTDLSTLRSEISLNKVGTVEWYITDEMVKFYTGLPNLKVLLALFKFVKDEIPSTRSSLEIFQKLSLTLMRMRLNLTIIDLGYRYSVSKSTVSTVFLNVLDVLYSQLQDLIKWPDREQLRKTTPMVFRKYFGTKVAVIIDCFEIFINKPRNVLARAQTWLN